VTGLSTSAVSTLVADLIEAEVLVEFGTKASGAGGRPAVALGLASQAGSLVGIHLGHADLRVVLTSLDGTVLMQQRHFLDVDHEPAASLDQLARSTADLLATGDVDPFTRAARSAAVGAAMTQTYGDGHPMATLGGGVFAVLARADEDPHPPLEALHREIARRCELLKVRASTRQPVRVWIEPLPPTHEQAVRMLDRVGRA